MTNYERIISEHLLPCACAIKIPIATGRVNIRIHREDGQPPLLAFALTEPTFGSVPRQFACAS